MSNTAATPEIRAASLRAIAMQAANAKCVNIQNRQQTFVMVWDGVECRVFATEEDNLHWSIPELAGYMSTEHGKHSLVLRYEA